MCSARLARPTKNHEGMLKTINRAILEHRVVEIEYQPTGKTASVRKIEPYGLAVYQSSIYVIAAAPEIEEPSERLRNWKLDRFHHATALDEYFQARSERRHLGIPGSQHRNFFGRKSRRCEIKLGKRAAGWVREDPWHPDQTLDFNEDQSAFLVVPASHPRELLPKVLALGTDAEVISPVEFREAVAEAVNDLAERYSAHSV